MAQKNPDWIASRLTNTITPESAIQRNEDLGVYEIQTPDVYWNKQSVQQLFQGDKNAFDAFYNKEAKEFEGFKVLQKNIKQTPEYTRTRNAQLFEQTTQPSSSVRAYMPYTQEVKPDFEGRTYGWLQPDTWSNPTKSWKEVAIANGVKLKDGSKVSWEKFPLSGVSIFATNKDGSLKFDEQGMPYLEEIDETASLSQPQEIVNPLANKMGMYGMNYGPVQFLGTLLNSPARMVNSVIVPFLDLGKLGTDEGSDADKAINYVRNGIRSQDWGTTQEAVTNRWGFESLFDGLISITGQLLGAKGVSNLTLGALSKVAGANLAVKGASIATKSYYTGLAVSSIGGRAMDQGLSKADAGLLVALSAPVFWKIMSLSEFAIGTAATRDVRGIWNSLGRVMDVSTRKGKLLTGAVDYRLRNMLASAARGLEGLPYAGTALSRGGAEALEEGIEQWIENTYLAAYDFANSHGMTFTGDPAKNFFGKNFENWDWEREWENTQFAMVAGALGGGLVGNAMQKFQKSAPPVFDHFTKVAIQGGEELSGFMRYVDAKHKAGAISQEQRDMIVQTMNTIHESVEQYGLSKIFNVYNTDLDQVFSVDIPKFLGDKKPTDLASYTSITQDMQSTVLEIEELRKNETLTEEQSNRLEVLQNKLAEFRAGKNKSKYREQLALHMVNSALFRNADKVGRSGVLRGAVPLNATELWQLNEMVDNGYQNEQTKRQKARVELIEESEGATRENIGTVRLTPAKLKELNTEIVNEIDQTLSKINELQDEEGLGDAIRTELTQLLGGTTLQEILQTNKKQLESYITQVQYNPEATQEEKDLIKSLADFNKLKQIKPVTIDEIDQDSMFFQAVTRKDGMIDTISADELGGENDIRKMIQRLEQTEQEQRVGDKTRALDEFIPVGIDPENMSDTEREGLTKLMSVSAYEPDTNTIEFLSRNIQARLDQIQTNMMAKSIFQDKLPRKTSVVYNREKLQEIVSELATLEGRLERLKLIGDLTKGNPEAIRQKTAIKHMQRTNKKIWDNILVSQVPSWGGFIDRIDSEGNIQEIPADDSILNDLDEFASTGQVDEYLVSLNKFENAVNKGFQDGSLTMDDFIVGLDPSENREAILLSYIQGLAALPSSVIYGAYSKNLGALNKTLSVGQFLAMQDVVRMAWSSHSLRPDKASPFTAILDAAGGAGKTAAILPMAAKVLNQLAKESYGQQEGKILLTAAPDYPDKLATLSKEIAESWPDTTDFVTSQDEVTDFLNKPVSQTLNYNVIILDEVGLLNEDTTREVLDRVNEINRQRPETHPPLRILFSGDTLQIKSFSKTQGVGYSMLDIGDETKQFFVKRTERLDFSFRSTNQDLAIIEKAFTQLYSNLNIVLPDTIYSRDSHEGVEIVKFKESNEYPTVFLNKAKAFLEDAINKGESIAIITDKRLHPELAEYQHLAIDPVTSQGNKWDKIIFIPGEHNIRATTDSESYARRAYYTSMTRAKKGILALLPDTIQGLNSKAGRVFSYQPSEISVDQQQEKDRVENILQTSESSEVIKTSVPSQPITPVITEEAELAEEIETNLKRVSEAAKEAAAKPVKLTELEDKVQEFLKSVRGAGPGVTLYTSMMVGETLANINLAKDFFYQPDRRANMNLSLVLGRIDKNRFKLIKGQGNYESWKERAGELRLFMVAKEGDKQVVVGALPYTYEKDGTQITLDNLFPNLKVPPAGIAIDIDHSDIHISSAAKNFEKAVSERSSKGKYHINELARQFKGMVVSDVMIATRDYQHSSSTSDKVSIKSGDAFVAVSFKHRTPEALNRLFEENRQQSEEEFITYWPLSTGDGTSLTSNEVEDIIEQTIAENFELDLDTLLGSELWQPDQVNILNQVLWHNRVNKSSLAVKDKHPIRAVFETKEEALQVPLINALYSIYQSPLAIQEKAELVQHLPYVVLESSDQASISDSSKHDLRTFTNRKTLLLNALRTKLIADKLNSNSGVLRVLASVKSIGKGKLSQKQKDVVESLIGPTIVLKYKSDYVRLARIYLAAAEGTQLSLYEKVKSIMDQKANRPDYVQPDFVLGEGMGRSPFVKAAVTSLPGRRTTSSSDGLYNKSIYQDTNLSWAKVHVQNGIEYPHVKLDWSTNLLETKLQPYVVEEVSSINTESPIITDIEEVDQDQRLPSQTFESGQSLRAFRDRFYPGAAGNFIGEGINFFRRKVVNSLYNLSQEAGPKLVDVDSAIKQLQAELQDGQAFENIQDRRHISSNPKVRAKYHEWVMGQAFDFLLEYAFPSVKATGKGADRKYTNYVKHKHHTGINSKEESALGENMTQMVKSMLYSTPILDENTDGSFKTILKEGISDPGIGTEYLSEASVPTMIEKLQHLYLYQNPDPTLSSRENFINLLREGSTISPHINSFYQRFFASQPYVVNGKTILPFAAIDNPIALNILDALESYMSSVSHMNYYTIDITKEANPLPTSEGGVGDLTYNTFLNMRRLYKDNKVQLHNLDDRSYKINGTIYTAGKNPGDVPLDSLIDIYHALDIEISPAMLEYMQKRATPIKRVKKTETEQEAEERVISATQRNIITELHDGLVKEILPSVINGNTRIRKLNILEKLSAADHVINGSPLRNFVRNVKGEKQYVLTKGFPLVKAQRVFGDSLAVDPELDNSFRQGSEWQLDSFLLKLGIRGDNPIKAASISDMQPDEHFEADFINGFLEPLQKSTTKQRKKIIAIPYTIYADSNTVATPVIRLAYDPASKDYVKLVNQDYINSRTGYLLALEKSIIQRWNNVLQEPVQDIGQLTNTIANFKGNISSLIPNLDYIKTDTGYKLKDRLVRDIKEIKTKSLTSAMLSKQTKEEVKRYKSWLEENPEMAKRAEAAAKNAGMTLDQALTNYYTTWRFVSYRLGNLTLGPEYQYKAAGEVLTEEVKDKIKRAKSLVSPFHQRLYRSPVWNNGLELSPGTPVTITRGEEIKVNGTRPSSSIMNEGYKLGPKRKIAVVSDLEFTHNLVSGEKFNQEVLDGATFVLPLYNYFLSKSNGGLHGAPTTNTNKPITFSMNNGVVSFIKNAQFTLTPVILKNSTEQIQNMVKGMLNQPLNYPVKLTGEVYKTGLDLLYGLGVKEDFSNIEDETFREFAEILVLSQNQDSIIHELVPKSSMKTGGQFINKFGSDKLVPFEINQTLGGLQLNATKDESKLASTKYSSQALSSISLNQPRTSILKLRTPLAQLTQLSIDEWNGKSEADLKASFLRGMNTSEESNSLISFQQRLKLSDPSDFSLSDQAVLRYYMPVQSSEVFSEGISPKYKGWDYIIHPADGILDLYRNKKTGQIKLKTEITEKNKESKLWEPTTLRYGEPTVSIGDEIKSRVPVTELEEFTKLPDRKARDKWLSERDDLEYGDTEVLVPRNQFMYGWTNLVDADVQPSQVTKNYLKTRILKRKFQEASIDPQEADTILKPMEGDKPDPEFKAFVLQLAEEAEKEAVEKKQIWDQQIGGILNRTPGTGKHSTTATKVVHFIDGSNNTVFVSSKLLTVKGADQDIDKESFVQYQIVNGRIPMAEDITPEIQSSGKAKDISFMKAALKNTVIRESREILRNPKNAYEAHQSVEGVLGRMKELARKVKQKARTHNSYADMVEMETENFQGKALISIFANIQKIYLTMKEVYTLTGQDMGFTELGKKPDQVSISLAGLINAATDAVKEGILANLGVDLTNGPLVSYWLMNGVSMEEIVNTRLKDESLQNYFKAVKKARRFDSEERVSQITKPSEWSKDIIQANAITSIASMLPNTADSAPSSLEDFINFHNRFKTIMEDLGVKDFNIYDFLSETDVARFETISSITEGINPLRLIQDVPHMKKYFELVNVIHQKNYQTIPAYKYVYEAGITNPKSSTDAIMYRVWQGFTERFFVNKDIKAATLLDSDGDAIDLTSSEGRAIFIKKMHNVFFPNLKSTYPATNKFVKELHLIEFTSTDRSTDETISEDMIQITDLRSLSDQRLAEVEAGFNELTQAERMDLFYYALMINGLREGGNSYAALLDKNIRMDWTSFLNNLDNNFEGIEPGELLSLVRQGVLKTKSILETKLGLPFDLKQLDKGTKTQYLDWINNTVRISRSDGNVFRKTKSDIEKKRQGSKMNESLFRSKVVGAVLEARENTEKSRNSLKKFILDYLTASGKPKLIEDTNINRINEIIDSTKQEDDAKVIEATELVSRIAFGKSPMDITSLDITNLGAMIADMEKVADQESIPPAYKLAMIKLEEIALQPDKRASWRDLEEHLKRCS